MNPTDPKRRAAHRGGTPVPVGDLVAGALASITPKNPHRITAREALKRAGMTLGDAVYESIGPACCTEGCEVEPDRHCPHGCPSVFLALGEI